MIPKKHAPDLIRGGNRFSEETMLYRKVEAGPVRTEPTGL